MGAAAQVAGVVADRDPDPDVWAGLDLTSKNKPVGSLRNMARVLEQDPHFAGRIRYSIFDSAVLLDGKELRDLDLSTIAIWMDATYGLRGATDNLHRAVTVVAAKNPCHPVRDWLGGLVWDDNRRLDLLLPAYFGAENTPLHRRFGACFLIGACARAFDPGCKLDSILMLIGAQGAGKSEACAALVPVRSWFSDSSFVIGDKDALINLQGKWIIELAEGDTLRKANNDSAKAFITSRVDRYRTPFARMAEDHPRQVVFVMTGNVDEVLRDPTGARRYWPVRVGDPDLAGLVRDRDQLFAEALVRYRGGEIWHLDGKSPALLVEAQRAFEVPEAWEAALAPWVDGQKEPFSVEDAMQLGLNLSVDRWTAQHRQRAGMALSRLGCKKVRPRVEGGGRAWRYAPPDHQDQAETSSCKRKDGPV